MYAKIERKRVTKARIILTPQARAQLCQEFGISASTLSKYIVDIFNNNVTANVRNKVLVAAINKYGGKLEETKTWKDVVVIDAFDEPENHRDEQEWQL